LNQYELRLRVYRIVLGLAAIAAFISCAFVDATFRPIAIVVGCITGILWLIGTILLIRAKKQQLATLRAAAKASKPAE